MTEPIGPGDLVECIEPHPHKAFKHGVPYRVRAITEERPCTCISSGVRPWAFAHAGLLFHDAPDPDRGLGWCIYSFRPISRRSSFERTLETLKQPCEALDPERALAEPGAFR